MKISFRNKVIFLLAGILFLFVLNFDVNAQAGPYIDFPEYHVEIEIDEDSTFTVTEKITSRIDGKAHGLRRDVTLEDSQLLQRCNSSPDLVCGSFDTLVPIGVYDEDGDLIDDATTYEVTEGGKRYKRFEWEIWADGKNVNDLEITWIVKYQIIGGIIPREGEGYRDPYFYWNIFPEERSGVIEDASFTIKFPEDTLVNPNRFIFYDDTSPDIDFDPSINEVFVDVGKLETYDGPYTAAYGFETGDIIEPGILNYRVTSPEFGTDVYLNGVKLPNQDSDAIVGFPSGPQEIEFRRIGYETETRVVNVEPGENMVLQVEMQRTTWLQMIYYIAVFAFILGVLLIPIAVLIVWAHYRKKGRDKNMPKTIIPLFSPPKGVKPYLLGSIKDEKVDRADIVGTIIDLAYRGYIKIKEVEKGKNYDLIKLEGKKDDSGLNEIEKQLLDGIFGTKDKITTKDLRTSFPQKYQMIENNIYDEMRDDGYFQRSPQTVRGAYGGSAVGIIILGGLIFAGATFVIFSLIGILSPIVIFTPGLAIIVAGISLLIASPFMPAKTEKGSKTYADILGFKMYLHTAERYRLQKLGPEEFERYLSYAIVFGIEEEWAKKFEGIYKGVPEWYEGARTGPDVFDAIIISSLMRDFANTTATSAVPIASSGASKGSGGWAGGSGWSGGSFGGFSGGGGGGGSVGGW